MMPFTEGKDVYSSSSLVLKRMEIFLPTGKCFGGNLCLLPHPTPTPYWI
jgi:hypothetical protein